MLNGGGVPLLPETLILTSTKGNQLRLFEQSKIGTTNPVGNKWKNINQTNLRDTILSTINPLGLA
jgi:hypothetical protein